MDYTPAQIGRVSDPAAHSLNAVPLGVDAARDDQTGPVNYAPREARSWRATPRLAPAAGPATDGQMGGLVDPHRDGGSPNARQQWGGTAGATGPADNSLRPIPSETFTGRVLEPINAQAPIDRPRAGSIGTDPTRPSWMPRWLYWMPFDQWAQYGAPALDKIPSASPLASRPLAFADGLPDAYPSAGGSGPLGTFDGVGPQPNTVRWLPAQWDADAVPAVTDNGSGYAAHQQARGWRLT